MMGCGTRRRAHGYLVIDVHGTLTADMRAWHGADRDDGGARAARPADEAGDDDALWSAREERDVDLANGRFQRCVGERGEDAVPFTERDAEVELGEETVAEEAPSTARMGCTKTHCVTGTLRLAPPGPIGATFAALFFIAAYAPTACAGGRFSMPKRRLLNAPSPGWYYGGSKQTCTDVCGNTHACNQARLRSVTTEAHAKFADATMASPQIQSFTADKFIAGDTKSPFYKNDGMYRIAATPPDGTCDTQGNGRLRLCCCTAPSTGAQNKFDCPVQASDCGTPAPQGRTAGFLWSATQKMCLAIECGASGGTSAYIPTELSEACFDCATKGDRWTYDASVRTTACTNCAADKGVTWTYVANEHPTGCFDCATKGDRWTYDANETTTACFNCASKGRRWTYDAGASAAAAR